MREKLDLSLSRQGRNEATRNGVFIPLAISLGKVLGVLVYEDGSVNVNVKLPVSSLILLRLRKQHDPGIDRRL